MVIISLFFLSLLQLTLQTCIYHSHTTAVDTVKEKGHYDLIITLGTKKDCNSVCTITDPDTKQQQQSTSISKYNLNSRNYQYIKFKSLLNGKRYTYTCIAAEAGNLRGVEAFQSEEFQVQFPKNKAETKLIAFGDWSDDVLGEKEGKHGLETLNWLNYHSKNYDAILFAGDLAYNLHNLSGEDKDKEDKGVTGDNWLTTIMNLTTTIPFMVSPGNHEGKEKHFQNYIFRFRMPNHEYTTNFYYSYDVNNVHILSINSEIYFNDEFSDIDAFKFENWLETDLKNSLQRWKIVYLHRPVYCSKDDKDQRCGKKGADILQSKLENFLYRNKVDLVIHGHIHAYERMYPVYQNKVDLSSLSADKKTYTNPKYTSYVTCGGAGNSGGLSKEYALREFAAVMSSKAGICELLINENSLKLNYVLTSSGQILDNFQIIKK